jgi:outer membrane protein assembly factor BamE
MRNLTILLVRLMVMPSLILALILACVACTKVIPYYKPDIKQGNNVTQVKVDQLKKGMSQTQVITILGSPSVQQTFGDNRLIYVNTNLPGNGKYSEKKLILYFKNGHLVSSAGDFSLAF